MVGTLVGGLGMQHRSVSLNEGPDYEGGTCISECKVLMSDPECASVHLSLFYVISTLHTFSITLPMRGLHISLSVRC